MNELEVPSVHWHVTIVLDSKMAAVISISVLIRLLTK
jgi:hypothetical protein